MHGFQIRLTDCLKYRILALAGDLDHFSATQLRERLHSLIAQGEVPLIVDMSGVTFCDSTGLGLAVFATKRALSYGGQVAFVGLAGQVADRFRLTRIDQFVTTYPSLDTAIDALCT